MQNKTPLVIIVGKPQHGKTTFRRLFEAWQKVNGIGGHRDVRYKTASCSDAIYRVANLLGVDLRRLPKEEVRPIMVRLGNALAEFEDTALVDAAVREGARVIDGVRRYAECQAVAEKYDCLFIKVVRDNPPAEVQEIRDNTQDLGLPYGTIVVHAEDIEGLVHRVIEAGPQMVAHLMKEVEVDKAVRDVLTEFNP